MSIYTRRSYVKIGDQKYKSRSRLYCQRRRPVGHGNSRLPGSFGRRRPTGCAAKIIAGCRAPIASRERDAEILGTRPIFRDDIVGRGPEQISVNAWLQPGTGWKGRPLPVRR
ncbi:hypothetical protein [Jiella sp. M17.18]|uniref:hypothetical protein n=1 Tax=Jiella sp. M17.18 TaxID=3234247 RepID=UPI0034DF457D